MEETKRCPYCGEEILAVAKKCKHCGEWLEAKEQEKEKKVCPVCGERIDADLNVCTYCKEPTHFGDSISDVDMSKPSENYYNPQNGTNTINTKNDFNTGGSSWKSKVLRTVGEYVLYIALGGAIAGSFIGIKQCAREKTKKNSPELFSGIGDTFKKEKEETLRKLTKAPWTGVNSLSETNSEDGWLIQTTATIDSKKHYASDNTYAESGLMELNITCSQSGLKWSAEGSVKFQETGEITVFSMSDMYEETKNFDGEIIGARVTSNNTNANDEDIAMNVRLKLNELMKAMQASEESTHYKINTLTETSLVLEEVKLLKPTGITLKYKR